MGQREKSEINIWKPLFRKINRYKHLIEFPLQGRRDKEEPEKIILSYLIHTEMNPNKTSGSV